MSSAPDAMPDRGLCWVDGRLAPRDAPLLDVDDSAFAEGRGCYTSVRIAGGRPRFAARHAARLRRDAAALGIGRVERDQVERALEELARAALPTGEGVVRLAVSRDRDGGVRLVGVSRPLEEEPRPARPARRPAAGGGWTAVVAEFPHPGPSPWGGCKVTNRLLHAMAAESARRRGADEALLFDAAGRLVEGARSNLFVVGHDGALVTPPLSRGAVAGIAREVVMERIPQVVERDVSRDALHAAEEIVAVNAVRGAMPITSLDDRRVAGRVAPRWADLLARALASD